MKHYRKAIRSKMLAIVGAAILFVAAPSQAALFTVSGSFTATDFNVSGLTTDPFTGSFSFDIDIPDPSTFFNTTPTLDTLTLSPVGATTFTADQIETGFVFQDNDGIEQIVIIVEGGSGGISAGTDDFEAVFRLDIASLADAFAGGIDVPLVDVGLANAAVSGTGRAATFNGSATVSAVPLPAALPLFLSGLSGLAFIRRRRAQPFRKSSKTKRLSGLI